MTVAHSSPMTDLSDQRANSRRALLAEIKARWSRFTEFEVSALADNGDLVNQVALKYGLEPSRAWRDVDVLLKGRKL